MSYIKLEAEYLLKYGNETVSLKMGVDPVQQTRMEYIEDFGTDDRDRPTDEVVGVRFGHIFNYRGTGESFKTMDATVVFEEVTKETIRGENIWRTTDLIFKLEDVNQLVLASYEYFEGIDLAASDDFQIYESLTIKGYLPVF